MSLSDAKSFQEVEALLSEYENTGVGSDTLAYFWDDLSKPGIRAHLRGLNILQNGNWSQLGNFDSRLDKLFRGTSKDFGTNFTETIIANWAALFPNSFWAHAAHFQDWFATFSATESKHLLARTGNPEKLLQWLEMDSSLKISSSLGWQAVLALQTTTSFGPKATDLILSRVVDNGDKAILKALNERVIRARQVAVTREPVSSPRVCLIIAGQVRNVENSLANFSNWFPLANLDVFVSSWRKVGRTRIEAVRLHRRAAPDQVHEISSRFSPADLEKLDEYERRQFEFAENDTEDLIRRCLKGSKTLHINLDDETQPVFSRMTNSEKMYYHNSFWPLKLGDQYFLQNYDLIIKVRPDARFANDNKNCFDGLAIAPGTLWSEWQDFAFREWGFGIGDQVLGGTTADLLPILQLTSKSPSIQAISRLDGAQEVYIGHKPLAVESLFQGLRPQRIPLRYLGLGKEKLMSVTDFIAMYHDMISSESDRKPAS